MTEPDGTPIADVTVRLFDIGLISEKLLGEAITDKNGSYRITYPAKAFLDFGKQRPDLDVRVFNAQGEKIAWLPGAPLFNAGLSETINLVRGGQAYLGPSDFQLGLEALQVVLQGADLTVLDEAAVSWLIGKTGQESQKVLELAKAARMAVLTQQSPALFYALFRVGLPQTLSELIGQSPETVRFALQEAVKRNLILSDNLNQQADELLTSFKALAVDLAMRTPDDPQRLSLGTLLRTTLESESLCRRFLAAYADHSGPIRAFWEGLEADPELGTRVSELQLTLQLGALSIDHQPMLDKLQQMRANGLFTSLADLVVYTEDDWHGIITNENIGVPPKIPGEDDTEKAHNYARVIADMVEQSFPTAFVAARLPDDSALKHFLTDHPDFDLKATRIGQFMTENEVQLADDDLARLRAMQRIYRLAPRWCAAEEMLDDGLDSAYRISRQGRNVFVNRYHSLLGAREVRCAYERAHQVHAMGLRLLTEAGLLPGGTCLQVLKDEPVAKIDTVPDWQALFQDSLELCGCEHCRSVLGPAAYLVDMLHFLSDRKVAEDETSAKDILFERRPDLGSIELSCENTTIPVPYVDLVNEILEDAVAKPGDFSPFTLDSSHDFEADLNAHKLSEELLAIFRASNCELERAIIRVGGEARGHNLLEPWWAIDDIRFTYNIRKQDNELKVISRSRQTRGSAAERRAIPQYLNPDAYMRLRVQEEEPCKPMVYPWSLPFDRDWEIIRIHLAHLQYPRTKVLETFLPGQRRAILTNKELINETLGLTAGEAMIVADTISGDCTLAWRPSDEPWKLWGFQSEWIINVGPWVAVIAGGVDIFLEKSGISYREMLYVFGTYYVNPIDANGNRTIRIESKDPDHPDTCETSQLKFDGLNVEAAVRIVRFVRLWRRLGWSMRDLDGAITSLAPTSKDIDEDFLCGLSGLFRLRQRLKIKVERMLPFQAPISTAVYIDHDALGQPRLPSLYDQLFRNRAVLDLPEPDFPEDPNDLERLEEVYTWSTCAATIAAALGISADDLKHLLEDENVFEQTDPTLNLGNLSMLYRHATLAKALRLRIPEYLMLLSLYNADPFVSPIDTLLFVEDVDLINESGFAIAELDYLLRHSPKSVATLAPKDEEIAAVLQNIRTGLQNIADEYAFRTDLTDPLGITFDANGDLTRQKLSLLEWDTDLIDYVVTTLNNTVVSSTCLDFLKRHLRAFCVPDFSTELDPLPEGITIPAGLKGRLYYDSSAKLLHFRGIMTDAEKRLLLQDLDAEDYSDFKAAVENLYDAASLEKWSPPEEDRLFEPEEINNLVDHSPPERFAHFLEKLLPYLQNMLSKRLIVQQLADKLGIEPRACARLCTGWLHRIAVNQEYAVDAFLDLNFAATSPLMPITREAFPEQFNTYTLLDKVALIISRLGLSVTQLSWLFDLENAPWPDLNDLPVEWTVSIDFSAWKHLWRLLALCRDLDPTEDLPAQFFDLVDAVANDAGDEVKNEAKEQIIDLLTEKLGWSDEDLQTLLGNKKNHADTGLLEAAFPEDYRGEHLLQRLQDCFRMLKKLGVSAALCQKLCGPLHDNLDNPNRGRDIANQVVQAVQAKYDPERWLDIAAPLRNELRELQRASLVSYLVSHPTSGKLWRNANDLYTWFLIDPEMRPCMMTSRMVQAHGVVQLFVQRCRMNLEPRVPANDVVDFGWRQWQWMKNYRVWEANRKVFLYPENWIEPELRDDKSPFFKELESELMQTDLTLESAAKAMLGYLEKLGEVANLEIVGQFHQPGEVVTTLNRTPDILHVFGRTRGEPHVYYYRRRMSSSHWTPWERVDLDIEGDHLIPVVWNRRLYLFWPIFTEKPKGEVERSNKKITQLELQNIIPEKQWEIKLAWSEYCDGMWSAKKTSSLPIEDTPGPEDAIIRASIDSLNRLTIQLVDKTPELIFLFDVQDNLGQYSEELETGHLSDALRKEFGDKNYPLSSRALVKNAKKWLCIIIANSNQYFIKKKIKPNPPRSYLNVYAYLSWAFIFDARKAEPIIMLRIQPPLLAVTNTDWYKMLLRLLENSERLLFLPTLNADVLALNKTPGRLRLLPPPDSSDLWRHPFFYMDTQNTFFAEAYLRGILTFPDDPSYYPPWEPPVYDLHDPYQMDLAEIANFGDLYAAKEIPGIQRPGWELSDLLETPYQEPSTDIKTWIGFYMDSYRSGGAAIEDPKVFSSTHEPTTMAARSMPGMVMHHDLNVEGSSGLWNGHRAHSFTYRYRFQTFCHPYVSTFVRQLRRDGLDGLLQRKLQREPEVFSLQGGKSLDFFHEEYEPTEVIEKPYPIEDVCFDIADDILADVSDAYGLYNSELFFHAPLLIADRLRQNQRFEDAQKWFHYIFDPTDRSGHPAPKRYWQTRPFFERGEDDYRRQHITKILELLAGSATSEPDKKLDDTEQAALAQWRTSVERWRMEPFQPHLIARMRPVAYQKAVVMKYIENLIAWGDQLFRRDTMESVTEATQLYILAAEILGKRPEEIPPRAASASQTFDSIEEKLDDFSNAVVAVEHFIPPSSAVCRVNLGSLPSATPVMLYFCFPRNEKLLGCWDIVADRLFKIRNCMNIEGVVRQLPLFQPPIDPGLLVRAAAAGIDIGSVLNDISGAVPHYRFAVMLQKAAELCSELKSLGASLLSTLEKKDAEALSQMRARHESKLLELVETVKKQQLEEAEQNLNALRRSRDEAVGRYLHYQKLLGVQSPQVPVEGQPIAEATPSPHVSIKEESGMKIIPMEFQEMALENQAQIFQTLSSGLELQANFANLAPNINMQPVGSGITYGGLNIGAALSAYANYFRVIAAQLGFSASRTGKKAQFAWRAHDWMLQNNQAAKQIMQIDAQILASQIRVEIARKDLSNHGVQMNQSKEVESFLRNKYTNQDLYGWMCGQMSGVYFQTYQLAFDIAKRAERAFHNELGLQGSNYIRFGHWDSLRKGLLAGEQLSLDIKRLENAYHEKNRREYELTKHISLLQVDPLALIQLRETGACRVLVPEALFDMDGPGHYFRRIKNVAISIPCVTGPYTSVNCKLTLLKSSIRKSPSAKGSDGYPRSEEDSRFIDHFGTMDSIIASSAQNDSGLFETNLRDERYLPFENAGVISEWRLELPANPNSEEPEPCQFDYGTISDVILHIRYTAREGGSILRDAAMGSLRNAIKDSIAAGMVRLFSIRHEFPTKWAKFQGQTPADGGPFELTINLKEEHYPFWSQGRLKKVTQVGILARSTEDPTPGQIGIADKADKNGSEGKMDYLKKEAFLGNLLVGELKNIVLPENPVGELKLFFDTRAVSDLWIAVTWGE
ncbi:MAG: neuraminidase-like domain-containing protein [Desulfatiglandaceae bacterium]